MLCFSILDDEFIDFDTSTSSTPQAQGAEGDMTDVQQPAKKMKKRNLGTLFKDNDENEQMPVISQEQQICNELQSYLTIPKLDFEEDLLSWWKAHVSLKISKKVFVCMRNKFCFGKAFQHC